MTKKILLALLLLAAILIGFVAIRSKTSSSIDADTLIQGNLTVGSAEVRTIKSGSVLRVTGDLTVNGKLECDPTIGGNGVLPLQVGGTLTVNGKLECLLDNSFAKKETPAISIVAKKILFSKDAEVSANGSVDIVHDDSLLLSTPEAISAFITESMKDEGAGSRVGPFVTKDPTRTLNEKAGTSKLDGKEIFAELRGTWHIGDERTRASLSTEAEKQGVLHPFLRVDMGSDSTVTLDAFTLLGADGESGADDIATNCTARGVTGGDGLLFRIHAGTINTGKADLDLGNGGSGGNAETPKNCAQGVAIGGIGGRPGNIKWTATQHVKLAEVSIIAGKGGKGGDAKAYAIDGKEGCPGEPGGGATATSGRGGESGYALPVSGTVTGVNMIHVTRVAGGVGGNAVALPGNAGSGKECGCAGGRGGAGTATPGDGGIASILLFTQTGEAHGGDAGKARVEGGAGGDGGTCVAETKGGDGGMGGNAVASKGLAGRGTTAYGNDGIIENMAGGAGGAGGTGCPAGVGGIGGLGAPLGANGNDGTSLCPEAAKVVPKDTSIPIIKAILYHGYYLPKDQLMVSKTAGCSEEHWRATRGEVKATNDTIVPDPVISACGFGKVSEMPVVNTPARVKDIGTQTP